MSDNAYFDIITSLNIAAASAASAMDAINFDINPINFDADGILIDSEIINLFNDAVTKYNNYKSLVDNINHSPNYWINNHTTGSSWNDSDENPKSESWNVIFFNQLPMIENIGPDEIILNYYSLEKWITFIKAYSVLFKVTIG